MKTARLFFTSVIVCSAMAVFAFFSAAQLPEGAELPTHWNAAGEVDDTMPALRALLLMPLMALVISALFAVLPRLEPLQERLEASAPLLRTAWIGTLFVLIFVQGMIAAPAYGLETEGHYVLVAVGALFLFLGNMLPKSRPGFFVGIRTPWTITDEDIWIATHRLGGKLMMAAGVILIIVPFVPLEPETRAASALPIVLGAVFIPVIYSWWLWQRKARRR